jgi:hypothetical protein
MEKDITKIIEKEGQILHEIKIYLKSKNIEDEAFLDKLNNMFEEIYSLQNN